MKRFAPLLLLVFCVSAYAIGPEYGSLRNWVEKRSTKDKTPVGERVFVNHSWKDSAIVHHKSGITLQEVIGQTQFRDRQVRVSVFRAAHKPPGEPVYDELLMKRLDRARFLVEALDVLWLEDPMTDRN